VSTYWRKKESEKAELFHKIEPYLTFLNVHQLERQGADIQTKVEELEELNQSLRQRDKVKDDAITQLSDQLVALSVRLQDIERRQGSGLAAGRTIEAGNSSAGDVTNVLTYENSTYGVKMQYPDNWTVEGVNITDTTGNFANFFSPNSEVVQIYIDGLGSSGFPLNDYLNQSIDGYKSYPQTFPNFQLISSDMNTVLAGHSAYALVGTYYDLDHGTQKVLEIGTLIDDTGYYIRYIADEPKYSALLPTVQNMINSFEISKP
jgi:hypothetical protein